MARRGRRLQLRQRLCSTASWSLVAGVLLIKLTCTLGSHWDWATGVQARLPYWRGQPNLGAPAIRWAAADGSRDGLDSSRNGSADTNSQGTAGRPLAHSPAAAELQSAGLLHNWCAPADKRATGWDGISDLECMQRVEEAKEAACLRVREGRGTLLFKHVHKAGGSTMCKLAQRNMVAEAAKLPNRDDWDTNCVPYEAFLGPHPAMGIAHGRRTISGASASSSPAAQLPQGQRASQMGQQQEWLLTKPARAEADGGGGSSNRRALCSQASGWPKAVSSLPRLRQATAALQGAANSRKPLAEALLPLHSWDIGALATPRSSRSSSTDSGARVLGQPEGLHRRRLQAHWLGGACWLGFLTKAKLRVLPTHFRPLTFLASEGPLPDVVPLDLPFAMVTMLRRPLNRVFSSYRWWQLMMLRMPASPAECRAYSAPANATLAQWLDVYPSNWMTRELVGISSLYRDAASGRLPELNTAHLLLAKQRLHYYSAVLIMENWEESARVMRDLFGWTDVDFRGHRAGSCWDSAAEKELEPALLERLRALNAMDLELYDYALALADSRKGSSPVHTGT